MPVKIISVGGGRVTSKDPSALEEGELITADDACYFPNNPALHSCGERAAYSPTAESARIVGGRHLEFDGTAQDLEIIHHGNHYATAPTDRTGTFTDISTGPILSTALVGGTSLDSVHYNNEYFLLNGVDANRVIGAAGTISFHGMAANAGTPTLSRDAGAGTGFTLTSGNTITYWVERRVKSGTTILKRNAENGDHTVTLTGDGTLDKPVITWTIGQDDTDYGVTHWALYGTATNGAFPVGAEIAEVAVSTSTIEDTRTGANPTIPTGSVYDIVSVAVAGVTQNVAKNGPPPIATTGDIFEDSLVLNDVSDGSRSPYSFPDDPHVFPSVNFIRFETKEQDQIQVIRRLGSSLIYLLRDSAWKVNYLPRPEDANFDTGVVKEQIDGAFGCVGPLAADTFSFGSGDRIAYVSPQGIVVTDGATWDVLTDDMDWENDTNPASLSGSILVNNPRYYRLEFYCPTSAGNRNMQCYYLHYHPSHAKNGAGGNFRAKVTGPIHVQADAAWRTYIEGQYRIFTAAQDRKVYLEGEGHTDESGVGGIAFAVTTRDMFINGIGGEARINKLWAHHQSLPGETSTMIITSRNEGDDDVVEAADIDLDRREHTQAGLRSQGEAFQFGFEVDNPASRVTLDYFAVDIDSLGESEEG